MSDPKQVQQRLMRLAREVDGLTWADRKCIGEAIALIDAAKPPQQANAAAVELWLEIDDIDEMADRYGDHDKANDCYSFNREGRHSVRALVAEVMRRAPAAQPVALSTLTDAQIEQIWLNARDDKNELKAAIYFARAILAAPAQQVTTPPPVAAEVEKDAQRYRWLKARLLCADFQYGEPSETCSALVFEIPEDMRVSANLDETIDAAMAGTGSDESKENGK